MATPNRPALQEFLVLRFTLVVGAPVKGHMPVAMQQGGLNHVPFV